MKWEKGMIICFLIIFSEPSAQLYSSHLFLEENCVDKASNCNEQNITNKEVKKLYNSLLKWYSTEGTIWTFNKRLKQMSFSCYTLPIAICQESYHLQLHSSLSGLAYEDSETFQQFYLWWSREWCAFPFHQSCLYWTIQVHFGFL